MATIIRYVNTASSGGDGTTNNTSGGTAAFASLSAAEAALRQNLTGVTCDVADEQGNNYIALDILCTGTSADTSAVDFSSGTWVTDNTHRIRIRLNGTGAGAKWDTTKYRLVASPGGYGAGTFQVLAALHITLQSLQIETGSNLDNAPRALVCGSVAFNLKIVNCFLRITSTTGTWDNAFVFYITSTTDAYSFQMRNTVLAASDGRGMNTATNSNAGTVARLYNCTVVNRGATARPLVGIDLSNASADYRLKNLLVQGPGSSLYVGFVNSIPDEEVTILTQDASSPTVGLRSKTITFVDAANWDYHLAAGDTDAIGVGTDLSADSYYPFSNDGDNQSRSGAWDVGADQYSSGIIIPTYKPFKISSTGQTQMTITRPGKNSFDFIKA